MHKSKGSASKFYTNPEELRHGYLHKSPPSGPLKSMKSWKRRFFVLFKTSKDCYSLIYFKSDKREKIMGEIDVSDISMLLFCPENHSMWGWIHDTFRCPIACVLLLRAAGRDYFLIGENSWETDSWFNVIYDVLKSRPDMLSHEDIVKLRARSAPPAPGQPDKTELDNDKKNKAMSMPCRPKMQAEDIGEQNIYDIPKSTRVRVQEPKNNEEKEGTDDGIYMDMATVRDLAMKTQEKAPSDILDSEDSDFYDCNNSDSGRWDRLSTKDARADGSNSRSRLPSIELELCVSQEDLKKHLSLTLDVEKPCKRDSLLLKGDEIVAVNDLCIENVREVEYYLSKLRKNEVTLTIRRLSDELQAMRVEH